MICSVCIATYKRPTLLEQTLASILAQVLPHDIIIETIVVDNDPERSAAGIVEKHHDTDSISFKYFSQPIKNISLTRNMAVHNASGTYLVLIDDDEVASPRWIATLLKAADKYGADGVFGPVLPIFDKSAPEWLVQRVIAAYNAGPRWVSRRPVCRRTRDYVRRVLLFYRSPVSALRSPA